MLRWMSKWYFGTAGHLNVYKNTNSIYLFSVICFLFFAVNFLNKITARLVIRKKYHSRLKLAKTASASIKGKHFVQHFCGTKKIILSIIFLALNTPKMFNCEVERWDSNL